MDSDTTATVDATEGGRGDVDGYAYEVLRRRLSAQEASSSGGPRRSTPAAPRSSARPA